MGHPHPYSPVDLHFPNFVPLQLLQGEIIVPYLGTSLFIIFAIWFISGKEFSKGESRYVARDPATVTVEAITVVLEGPASLLSVYAIARQKSDSHILQFTVCLGQLYGCLVYFITAYLGCFNFWASPFYFRAYFHWCQQFVGCNSNSHRHKELEEDLCSTRI